MCIFCMDLSCSAIGQFASQYGLAWVLGGVRVVWSLCTPSSTNVYVLLFMVMSMCAWTL